MTMLRISKLTDYAILMMVELTREGEMLSAHALAERIHVETPTASKVLKLLSGRRAAGVLPRRERRLPGQQDGGPDQRR